MYFLLVIVVSCLLAESKTALAAPDIRGRDLGAAGARDRAFHESARHESFARHASRLLPRQTAPLPVTTVAECDTYDGFFYITPGNYTWQLQCTTNYDGSIISQSDAASLAACIDACVQYNAATTSGACLGVNFNAANHAAAGLCTQYSDVQDLLLASEEGNVQDSALLILGPNGQIFATPQPEPTFSGAPSQPPSVDPVPTLTTSTLDVTSIAQPSVTTTQSTSSGAEGPTTTTTTIVTSTMLVVSCPVGASACLSSTSTSSASTMSVGPSLGSSTTSMGSGTSSSATLPNESTTTQAPLTTSPASSTSARARTTTRPGGVIVDAITTVTMVMPVTEYRVQIVEICAATPSSCSQSTVTSTSVGYRTEVSCTPSECSDIATGVTANAVFTGTCVIP